MEDLWKKFKEETQGHMEKINDFLNERSFSDEPSKVSRQISKHLVLDEETVIAIKKANEKSPETSQIEVKASPRKKIYGKLKHVVKDIMEKENLSRAQAYRVAKKRILNNF
jgi:hypothetical protein